MWFFPKEILTDQTQDAHDVTVSDAHLAGQSSPEWERDSPARFVVEVHRARNGAWDPVAVKDSLDDAMMAVECGGVENRRRIVLDGEVVGEFCLAVTFEVEFLLPASDTRGVGCGGGVRWRSVECDPLKKFGSRQLWGVVLHGEPAVLGADCRFDKWVYVVPAAMAAEFGEGLRATVGLVDWGVRECFWEQIES